MTDQGSDIEMPAWALADVLSSARYWVLVLALLLAAAPIRALFVLLPLIAASLGASYEVISLLSVGAMAGWPVGGVMALCMAPRWPVLTLVLPIAGFALGMGGLLTAPVLWSTGAYLLFVGMCTSAFAVLSVVTVAGMLASARLCRTDLIHGLTIPVLLVGTVPELAVAALSAFVAADEQRHLLTAILMASSAAACLLLAAARPLVFRASPPLRHAPLRYRRRSPWTVASIGLLPMLSVAWYAMTYILPGLRRSIDPSTLATLHMGLAGVGVLAALYVLHWVYRVHGEAAGMACSSRLLKPLAATLIWLIVPLGYLLVMVLIGKELRARMIARWGAPVPSDGWLAFWSVVAPPVAMGMIQHALNRLGSDHSTLR